VAAVVGAEVSVAHVVVIRRSPLRDSLRVFWTDEDCDGNGDDRDHRC